MGREWIPSLVRAVYERGGAGGGPGGSATISATSLTCISLLAVLPASVIIVRQNGQPTASVSLPVAIASAKRFSLTRSRPCSSSFHICAPPAPQQNELLR